MKVKYVHTPETSMNKFVFRLKSTKSQRVNFQAETMMKILFNFMVYAHVVSGVWRKTERKGRRERERERERERDETFEREREGYGTFEREGHKGTREKQTHKATAHNTSLHCSHEFFCA